MREFSSFVLRLKTGNEVEQFLVDATLANLVKMSISFQESYPLYFGYLLFLVTAPVN